MNSTIVASVIALVGTIISAIVSVVICLITQSKTTALMEYRMDKVEEKMDKHNNMIERTFRVEAKIENIEQDVRELKKV